MVCVGTVQAAFVFICQSHACWVVLLQKSMCHLDDCNKTVCVCASSKYLPVGHHHCCLNLSISLCEAEKHRAPFKGVFIITIATLFALPMALILKHIDTANHLKINPKFRHMLITRCVFVQLYPRGFSCEGMM